jgi:hypothetical protein
MDLHGKSLDLIVRQCEGLCALRREDLHVGDIVYVRTCNSLYCIRVEEHRDFRVSGGWFDRRTDAPVRTGIVGCTWGGSIVKVDVVAAVGLSIEFGNRVTTSPIQKIFIVRQGQQN